MSNPQKEAWWQQPHRVLLINLREGDEPRIEANAFVDDVQRYGATAFCINGGGIVAFYQTQIDGHRKSEGLQGRDLLSEIIPVAHARGIRVLARIDPSCAPKELAETHPEWFSRDADGNFREVSGHYVTCPNADYYHQRMVEVVTEILTRYDADGIWNNQGKFAAWDTDTCYCDTCKARFRRDSGHDIPAREDWNDPVWREFNEWRYRRIAAWVAHMHGAIHAAKDDAVFIAAVQLAESLETIRPGGWDIDYWLPYQDVLAFECQRRNTAPWWPGLQAKYLSGIAPDKPRWMTVSYFYPWWRLAASPEQENRPWIAQQFANGVNTWLHITGAAAPLFDRRGFGPMQQVMRRLGRWEPYFDGAHSQAQVALVYSRFTQDNYGRDDPYKRYVDAVRGYYCALLEGHIPFDVLSDKLLDAGRLSKYRVLVLPNCACLSDEAAAAVLAFAQAGGTVVASFETGLYDQAGVRRASPALASLFGGAYGGTRRNLRSSYAQLRDPSHPLLAGLGDTDLVPNDGDLVEFEPAAGAEVPLTLVPPITVNADATISIPEYSAIAGDTNAPVAVRTASSAGRAMLFCNQMDALFYRYGFADLGRILANAVADGLGEHRDLEVIAPDYVDTTSMGQPGRRMVHLINFPLDKPVNSGWRHPGRHLVPVHGIVVRLRPPQGARVTGVRLASTEAALPHRAERGWVEVTVPVLDDHEIVVFDLA